MSSPLTFDRPLLLLLLPAAWAALWAIARYSRLGLHPATRRQALILRAIAVSLLIFALAGAHLVKRSNNLTAIFLLDVSHSIRPDKRAQGLNYIRKALATKDRDDQAGVVVFGRTAYLEDAPSDTLQQLDGIHASVAGDATDLADALRLAAAAMPPDTGRKIVVLSDGDENLGDAAAEIDSLRADNIRVDVAPTALGPASGAAPEAMVDDVELPSHVRATDTFDLRVIVSSTVAQTAALALQRDGKAIGSKAVALKPGKNVFTFPQRDAQSGFHRYDCVLTPKRDGIPQNNHGYGFVTVEGKPRVLYVAEPGSPSSGALRTAMAAQGIGIEVMAPGALPTSVAPLMSYDAVVLSDVPASEVGASQMTALAEASRDFGIGLGMIGGTNSFGAGDYGGTPLEAALPVKMDVRSRKKLPSAAVVVVLDASGSMAATEDGVEKVQLGARAAVQLMQALRPDDQVAVTAVTETSTIVVPLQSAAKAEAAKVAIEGVHAGGGGIYCRQGLYDAYALLIPASAPIKHVIICADTSDSEQQQDCVAMAAEMRKRYHISTTVCGIGHAGDQHVPFQRALAAAGGGQLFIVNKAADLPSLFQRDVQSIQQSGFVEHPFFPKYNPSDTVVSGIPFASEPPLLGYNLTTAKPGATVALSASGENDPIFAYWRYGLGRTFAFTSDDRAHWAAEWLRWPGYSRFWAQTLRWSLRGASDADFQTTVSRDNGRAHIAVEGFTQSGGFINNASLAAHIIAPDLSTKQIALDQTAPGRYEATFNADQTGAYMINIRRKGVESGDGTAASSSRTVGFVVPYSPEYRTLGPNLPLLTQMTDSTGGKIQTDPTQIFRDSLTWIAAVTDLSPALLLLTAFFFFADVAVRRLAVRAPPRREALRRGADAVGAQTSNRYGAAGQQPLTLTEQQAEQLLVRKVTSRSRDLDDITGASERVLSRRAAAPKDDPFPQVASLRRNPRSPGEPSPPEKGYAERIQDAQRLLDRRDD